MGYKGRNISLLSDSQAAIKMLNNFQVNSKRLWNCHDSMVKVAENNMVQLIWVLGNVGYNGN